MIGSTQTTLEIVHSFSNGFKIVPQYISKNIKFCNQGILCENKSVH